MEAHVFAIDPSGYYQYYGLLVAVATVIFAVVYALLRRPSLRRAQFRALGARACSRPVSLAVACLVSLPIAVYAHLDCWSHFYSAKAEGDKLALQYLFPPRIHNVPVTEHVQACIETEVRKGGLMYRVSVTAGDGVVYTSQRMSREHARRCLTVLETSAGIEVAPE